jgi:hypothetical protein
MVMVTNHETIPKTSKMEKTPESVSATTIASCTRDTGFTHPKFNG